MSIDITPTEKDTDNFSYLEEKIKNELINPGDFVPIIIIKRKKDNPEMSEDCKVLYRKNIYNIKNLQEYRDYLITLCKDQNARLYSKINKRNDKLVAEKLMIYTTEKFVNKEYKCLKNAYDHCVGISNSADISYYLIDVDFENDFENDKEKIVNKIKEILDVLLKNNRMKSGKIYTLKTKNGFHILVPGFDIKTFNENIKELLNEYTKFTANVQKDADTIIFMKS